MLEKLEQKENDLCAEITLKICRLADESGYGRDYYMNRILERLQEFSEMHDLSNVGVE